MLRRVALPRRSPEDDLLDVPATVLCALCGDPECGGCANEPSRSGIVAIVAWERPGAPFLHRLWSTARATTLEPERFFETLPDGPIAPALRFAVICEVVAATAMTACVAGVAAAVVPQAMASLAGLLARVALIAIPGLALLLVAAHAAHGLALDRGARRVGARPARSRALRFGLYATGWDLVIGPVGAVVVALKDGLKSSLYLASAAVSLPSRSARAFLRGAYRLDGRRQEGPLRASYIAAVIATLVGALAVLGAVVAVVLT
jgi:hypothetical protein